MAKETPPPLGGEREGKVTQRLVELLHSRVHPEDMVEHQEHEEEIHIDERWLISYADKMTILCGFFIMFFSISTVDPVKMKQLQDSTDKSFGNPVPTPVIDIKEVEQIRANQEQQQKEIEALKHEKESLQNNLQTLASAKQVAEQLLTKNRVLEEKVRTLQKELDSRPLPTKPQPDINKIREELAEVKRQLVVTQTESQEKTVKIEKLTEELRTLKAVAASDFMAFVMSWSTHNQDLDLYVEDPQNRKFDFKHREYPSHPGLLVLDTRNGPGVEVWQADKIIPGIYTFTYVFYNPYGNPEPATVTGTLFTSKGRIEMPKVTLDSSKNKTTKFKISIDDKGKAKLIQ